MAGDSLITEACHAWLQDLDSQEAQMTSSTGGGVAVNLKTCPPVTLRL